MPLYFALETVENIKTKKSLKFQGDMLKICEFIQVYVFTTSHHLKITKYLGLDIIIKLKLTTIFDRCAILNVLNCLTKNFES